MADYDYSYGRSWYSPGNLPQRKASSRGSSSKQKTTSSSKQKTTSSKRGYYGKVALTTPAATQRISLPRDIVTETIINTPVRVSQRKTQEPSSQGVTQSRQTTSERQQSLDSRNTTQQPVTPQPNITGGYTYTPTASGTKVSRSGWSFEVPTQPQISQEDWNTYINQPIVDNNTNTTNYDTNYIRGFRGQGEQGYRDVNSYLTWLRNNKDSADYKLFMQNGYFKDSGDALDGNELDYDQIRAMLASQGIRGNLGRRDSRRLGNVLTRLRDQSTAGTDANKEFLQGVVSSYNQNKDKWVKPAEGYTGLRNATITGDGQIGFLDESGNETYFPYTTQRAFPKQQNIQQISSLADMLRGRRLVDGPGEWRIPREVPISNNPYMKDITPGPGNWGNIGLNAGNNWRKNFINSLYTSPKNYFNLGTSSNWQNNLFSSIYNTPIKREFDLGANS